MSLYHVERPQTANTPNRTSPSAPRPRSGRASHLPALVPAIPLARRPSTSEITGLSQPLTLSAPPRPPNVPSVPTDDPAEAALRALRAAAAAPPAAFAANYTSLLPQLATLAGAPVDAAGAFSGSLRSLPPGVSSAYCDLLSTALPPAISAGAGSGDAVMVLVVFALMPPVGPRTALLAAKALLLAVQAGLLAGSDVSHALRVLSQVLSADTLVAAPALAARLASLLVGTARAAVASEDVVAAVPDLVAAAAASARRALRAAAGDDAARLAAQTLLLARVTTDCPDVNACVQKLAIDLATTLRPLMAVRELAVAAARAAAAAPAEVALGLLRALAAGGDDALQHPEVQERVRFVLCEVSAGAELAAATAAVAATAGAWRRGEVLAGGVCLATANLFVRATRDGLPPPQMTLPPTLVLAAPAGTQAAVLGAGCEVWAGMEGVELMLKNIAKALEARQDPTPMLSAYWELLSHAPAAGAAGAAAPAATPAAAAASAVVHAAVSAYPHSPDAALECAASALALGPVLPASTVAEALRLGTGVIGDKPQLALNLIAAAAQAAAPVLGDEMVCSELERAVAVLPDDDGPIGDVRWFLEDILQGNAEES